MTVRAVQTRRDLQTFIDLPYRLHAADPCWAPPLRREMRSRLSSDNPFFEHGEAAYFLARRDGAVVGRVAAITNHLHNATHEDRVGFFGFFECVDDPLVARELLEAVAAWVRRQGHATLRGPASFSVNEECGMLVEGFDTPPTLMMPHNPPYYPRLLEGAGLQKAKDLWVYRAGRMNRYTPVPERLARGAEMVGKRLGVTLRSLDMGSLEAETEGLRQVYNAAWEHNWGFVPLTAGEIRHLARQFKPVVIPELVPLAEKEGQLIGFGLAIPDLNQVLLANRRGRLFPAALQVLWALWRRRIRRLRIVLLGVLPEYRGKGIDAMLYHWIWTRAREHRIYWGEAGWILEDNAAMNAALEKMTFRRYKTYRLYEGAL